MSRKPSLLRLWLIVSTALVIIVIAACGVSPSATPVPKAADPAQTPTLAPQRGGALIDATFADAVSLQPLLTSDSSSTNYQDKVYAALTRIDPQSLDVVGVLYDGGPTFSADGTKMTWKLRKDATWSDGKPITAQDVEFTWQKMMDEKVKFIYRKSYQDSFKDVKAIDGQTVEYTLTTPGYCPAVANAGLFGPLPKSVFENLDINTNDANNKPTVTSGYFKFTEWQKDDHFTAAPGFAGFVRGLPMLDSYTYRIVKDNTVQSQLFKTQEVDVAQPDPVDWDEMSKLPHAQPVAFYPAVGASWTFIGFNLRNPLLADKTLRQAISTAINKKEMINQIRLGHARPQFSMLPASSWAAAAESDLPQFAFDQAKARKMLDDAGYKLDANGNRLSKDGKPLKFRIHYNSGNKQREMIATISQQYLQDIGIQTEVIVEEWNAYLERVTKTFDMDMFVLGWVGGWDPASTKNIWGSTGGQNSTGYSNATVDKLYADAETAAGCKQADRKAKYVEIQKIIAEDQPYVFLYTNESLLVYNKRFNMNAVTALGAAYETEKITANPQYKK